MKSSKTIDQSLICLLFSNWSNESSVCIESETTIEGPETRSLSREILPQCCARLPVAVSRVLIRHGVCCGNTYWTVFSEKLCVERIWDWVSKHNKTYIPFEAELYVDCSKAIQNTINAIPVLLKTIFTLCQNTIVCSSRRQPQHRMESFVLKGSETRHLNITNQLSFDTE